MVTRMPREARSIASVRPTGPAPAIRTSVSKPVFISRSLELDARGLDHLAPLLRFRLDVGLEFSRLAGRRFDAQVAHVGLDLAVVECGRDLRIEALDDRGRC